MYNKTAFPGYLSVEIKGENCQKLLSMCTYHNVPLWDVKCLPDSYSFKLPWKQYETILPLCEKTNSEIIILSRHGMRFFLSKSRQHFSFLTGILLCIFLILFFHTRIWDIQVTGNIYYDSPVLIEYLKTREIAPGVYKGNISCIDLANKIRQEFPKIKWTSVELVGSNLIVHIKENLTVDEKATETRSTVSESSDLIADQSGVIKSIYVRSGIANVSAGDTCQRGDVLVKGQIPIYNDAQEVVRYDYVNADADIVLQRDYSYYAEVDRNISVKKLIAASKHAFFQIGSCYLSFFPEGEKTSEESNTVYDRMQEISQWKLTSSLALPFYWGYNTNYKYESIAKYLSEEETTAQLEEDFFYFCDELEKKGVQIYQNDVKMYISDVKGVASGKVTVYEKTGKKQEILPEEFSKENLSQEDLSEPEAQDGTIQEE